MSGFNGFRMPSENSSRENNRGEHILKQGSGLIKRPSWSKSDPTVVRIFPSIQNGAFQPTRYTENDFSGWFYACSIVSGFGNPQKSWIIYDPEDRHYDTRSNPAMLIYDLANQVSNGKTRGPQEWALALKGSSGRAALITKPDIALISRCAIYEYKGQPNNPPDGLAPNHQTVYLLLKKSAWTAMNRELGVRSQVNSEDANQKFLHGDIVNPVDGSYLVFFEMGLPPKGYESQLKSAAPAPSWGNARRPIGYDCIISKQYRGMPATFSQDEISNIARRVSTPIRDNLNFPSDEEQVRFIVDSMRDTAANAALVVHALRDRYERLLPSDFVNFGNEFLRQVGLMATSVSNPGFAPNQQIQHWQQPAHHGGMPVQQFQQPIQQPYQQPAQVQPNYQAPAPNAYMDATAHLAQTHPQSIPVSMPQQSTPAMPHPVPAPTAAPVMNNMADLQSMVNQSVSEASELSEQVSSSLMGKLRQMRAKNTNQ